ncbi:hypothetical protein D1BOALGB6SA_3490 [Olavius sp. associated proteobacterium Delta 1]|nr:hypothetical protein D1BOALGB6SA_3490 [Olavius sp. associated proteobacterium Delta 1]
MSPNPDKPEIRNSKYEILGPDEQVILYSRDGSYLTVSGVCRVAAD